MIAAWSGLAVMFFSGLALFTVVRAAGMQFARTAPLRRGHRNGVMHREHDGCKPCNRKRLLRGLPMDPPPRPPLLAPSRQAALYEEVMAPLSTLIAEAEDKARAEWDAEQNPPAAPPAPEPPPPPAAGATRAEMMGGGGRWLPPAPPGGHWVTLAEGDHRWVPDAPVTANTTHYSLYVDPGVPVEALHLRRARVEAEMQKLTWGTDGQHTTDEHIQWNALWREHKEIERHIRKAEGQD